MANILVATLGDHPAVVTGMVKMLHAKKGITLDEIAVFHTKGSGKKITDGVLLLLEALEKQYTVIPHELPFADPTSRAESIEFLRRLNNVLNDYEQRGDTVYLSLAGGRKNMSALIAVICQFYPSVKGLFHLITHSDSVFPSVEQLSEISEEKRQAMMEPPEAKMTLVEIPYHTLSNAVELRRYFAAESKGKSYPIQVSDSNQATFEAIFKPFSKLPLSVYMSKTAIAEYQSLDIQNRKIFDNYFRDMIKPGWTEKHLHSKFEGNFETDCYCVKKGGLGSGSIAERVFFYRHKNQIIISRLTAHAAGYEKLIKGGVLWKKDHPPEKSLREVQDGDAILLVPLGESPMVASQTYTLLQQADWEWEKQKVVKVVVLYPEQNSPIRDGAKLLEKAFKRRGLAFEKIPITGLRDVDSFENAQIYRDTVIKTINNLRRDHPDKQIALSLSGGRKGMSALTLFAAQGAGVSQVYHTTITDPDYEQMVLRETRLDKLPSNRDELAKTLFLDKYDLSNFTLFEIPVISLESPQ